MQTAMLTAQQNIQAAIQQMSEARQIIRSTRVIMAESKGKGRSQGQEPVAKGKGGGKGKIGGGKGKIGKYATYYGPY